MNNDNGFDLIIVVVFAMIPQLGGLGPKSKDLVIYFHLGEGDSLPKLHLRGHSCLLDRKSVVSP